MRENALVTVIVPVYNMENKVGKCLESLIAQSYTNMQIIVIDDGSTDESLYICKKYQEVDERIRVLTQDNKGVSEARNKGLEISKGEYIIFIDSDDYVKREYVQLLVQEIDGNKVDIVECGYIIKNEITGECQNVYPRMKNLEERKEICMDFCRNRGITDYLWNKIFRAELFYGLKFCDLACSEDFEILTRILNRVEKVRKINECLYIYVRTSQSMGMKKITEKNFDIIKAREIAFSYYQSIGEDNIANVVAVQILSQIYILYREIGNCDIRFREEYKKNILEKFPKYYAYAKQDKENFVKDIYRKVKFNVFKVFPNIAVKLFK